MDAETGKFYFIEVNPRIQVEHTVSEAVTGLDIVKAQIRIAAGGHIGNVAETGIPPQGDIRISGHAMQCRITTENPENNFIPDYGRITAYRGAIGFGIRVDAVRPGSLLEKADLAVARINAEDACGRTLDDNEFSTYLAYPKVFAEFNSMQRKYGPVSVLPTPIFFYGMNAGNEATLEIENGKKLVVLLTAIGGARRRPG
jgi:pyruvate carboxylase